VILLPIGRDDAEIRRHAWVSYAIIAVNVLVFIVTSMAERRIASTWQEAVQYHAQRPYLDTPENLPKLPGAVAVLIARARGNVKPPPPDVVAIEQHTLDRLTEEAVEGYRKLPPIRFGYTPAEGGIVRLLTSMFIHAGFMHLFGNLLFFYLSGPFVEDVFGRPLFAALYFTGGIAAALTYAAVHPNGRIPVVGASGAIAALMGAYLVRFAKSKIEFLFIPLVLRPSWIFRFYAPAIVVLPLWFLQQFAELRSEAAGGGVAFSAHVGGFVYGFVVALLVKYTSFEEKFVNPVVEKETTWAMDERVVRALAARDAEDYETAKRELAPMLREDPRNIDALQTAIDIARATNDVRMYDGAAIRLLNRYIEDKHDDLAATLIHETTTDRVALPKFFPRAASFAERKGDRDWALTLYHRAVEADPNAFAPLIKIGTLQRLQGDMRGARETFVRARAHPACTAEWAPTIDAKISQCGS